MCAVEFYTRAALLPADREGAERVWPAVIIHRMDGQGSFAQLIASVRSQGVSAASFLSSFGLRASGVEDDDELWALIEDAGPALLMQGGQAEPAREKLPQHNTLEDAVALLKGARKVMVLTGAGISVACGIPDFRSKGGLYDQLEQYGLPDPQCMFDRRFFNTNPRPFFHFATKIFPLGPAGSPFVPSVTHRFISELGRRGQLLRNYTQNIDQIELKAGISKEKVVFCHGSFERASCARADGDGKHGCGYSCEGKELWPAIRDQRVPPCPKCGIGRLGAPADAASVCKPCGASPDSGTNVAVAARAGDQSEGQAKDADTEMQTQPPLQGAAGQQQQGGVLKPNIVFFGEPLGDNFHDQIRPDLNEVDLVIVMGSSLTVSPVRSIPAMLPETVPAILINREVAGKPSHFDIELLGDCDQIVAELAVRAGWGRQWMNGAAKMPPGHDDDAPSPFYWTANVGNQRKEAAGSPPVGDKDSDNHLKELEPTITAHAAMHGTSNCVEPWYWERRKVRGETCNFDVMLNRPQTMIFPGGVAPEDPKQGATTSTPSDEEDGADMSDGDVDMTNNSDEQEPDDTAWAAGFSAPDDPENTVDTDGIPEIGTADFDVSSEVDVDGLGGPDTKKRRMDNDV